MDSIYMTSNYHCFCVVTTILLKMKNKVLVFLFLFVTPMVFGQSGNLAPNSGFEQGTNSWVVRSAQIDKSVKHSGKSSLRYTTEDAKNYKVIVTHIPVKGGESLRFSVWVKGLDIQPAQFGKKGAGIYLHAYDENNKSLGGSNPPTPSGTFDWTKVEGLYEVPAKARKIAISLYIVKGNTGTAWFDDVIVEPFTLKLGTNTTISSRKVTGNTYLDSEGFTVKDGKRIFPFGIYIGKAEKQKIWENEVLHLSRLKEAGFNTVLSYIHGDRSNGGEYLDRLDSLGLYSIYSLSYLYDGNEYYYPKNGQIASERISILVNELKSKKALLAWYTGDEIELSHILTAKENFEIIKNLDKDHLVYQVANKKEMVPKLVQAADVFGMDPYPINKMSTVSDLGLVRDLTSYTIEIANQNRGVWPVIQIFNKVAFQKEISDDFADPSQEEMQNMLYQAVIEGAKGIMFYAYHTLWYGNDTSGKGGFSEEIYQRRWSDVSSVSKSFEKIIPIILSGQPVDLPKLKESKGLIWKAWKFENEVYIMIANIMNTPNRLYVDKENNFEIKPYGSLFVKL